MDTQSVPRVSIITVCFNSEKFLEQAMLSVINQNYPNLEYIIIDGGSTDGTLEIIKRHETKLAFWSSEPDKGIYDAMNKGISKATGQLIAFKNADDWFCPNAVKKAAETWLKTKAAVIYGQTLKVWSENPLQTSLIISDHTQLFKASRVDHRTSFTDATWLHRFMFDTRYRIVADYKVNLSILTAGGKFVSVPAPFSYMRFGGASDTYKVFAELRQAQSEFYGSIHAWKIWTENVARYLIMQGKNSLLKKVLGPDGYAKFKARKSISKIGLPSS